MIYRWAVIGAGPAGIAAVGKLIDAGIPAKEIAWFDPHFATGDVGRLWRNVPSNTKVELFIKYLNASAAFNYKQCPHDFAINHLPPKNTCKLGLMVEPLQWITDHLIKKVHVVKDTVEWLSLKNRQWHIKTATHTLSSQNVILAIGATPKNLSYPNTTVIPLEMALDTDVLPQYIEPEDTISVFGASHSAILALKNLVEHKVKRIINFYRHPLCYAKDVNDWILFDNTGLKGIAAEWAREHIDGQLPANLTRVYANEENIEHYLPLCTKTIYAVGFERRHLPVIENMTHISCVEQCGIIAPGLFGFGIAFPEAKLNPLGILEYRVGMWKFMDYLSYIMPIWLNYGS